MRSSIPEFVTSGIPILNIPLGILFCLLSLALGRRLLRILGATGQSLAERGVIALGLGAGCFQFLPLALGAVGLLRPTNLNLAVAAAFVLLIPDLKAVVYAIRPLVSSFQSVPRSTKLWLVALAPPVLLAGLMALAPTTDPDGLSYHLTAPKRWLGAGWVSYLPTYPYTNGPMGVEMLFAIGLAAGGDTAAKLLHLLLGTSGLVGLYLIGLRYKGSMAGLLVAALYLVAPRSVAPILGAAYVEGAAAFAMIASLLAWMIWYQSREYGWLKVAALLAGIAVSFKLTAVVFPMVLGAVTLACLTFSVQTDSTRSSVRTFLGLVPVLAAPVLPWLVRAAVLTGNPLFPVFAKYLPSRDYPPEYSARFEEYNRYMVWGAGADWSLEQRKLMVLALILMLCAGAGLLCIKLRTKLERSIVLILLGGVVLQVYAAGLYFRYWMPVLAVLAVPLVCWLGPALEKPSRRLIALVITGLLSLYQARQIIVDLERDVSGAALTALGVMDGHEYRLRHLPLTPLYDHINSQLPANAKVLLTHYCGGFYIDRPTFCAEFVQTSLRFESWQAFVSDARRLGVSHVIAPRILAEGKAPPIGTGNAAVLIRANMFAVMQRLLKGHATLRAQALDQGLYEIKLPDTPEPS